MDVVVPIKRFSEAKTRLAGILPQSGRAWLAELLATSVIDQLSIVRRVRRVILASSEPVIGRVAARYGFEVLADDPSRPGLNAAVERAVERALASGATDVGIVFSDLPLFNAWEFDRIVETHLSGDRVQVTVVPDRHGTGTNVRLCRPGNLLPALYGTNSALEYRRAAALRGARFCAIQSHYLSHDLDRPADIAATAKLGLIQAMSAPLRSLFATWHRHEKQGRQGKCA